TASEILHGDLGRQPKARPIGGYGAVNARRAGNDIAPLEQSIDCFLDFIARKRLAKFADEFAPSLAALRDCRSQRAIEFAVQEEFPVLRIEADDILWQQVGAEIRRESQDVLAPLRRAFLAANRHGANLCASHPPASKGRALYASATEI